MIAAAMMVTGVWVMCIGFEAKSRWVFWDAAAVLVGAMGFVLGMFFTFT